MMDNFQISRADREDVYQEIAILRWQGKNPKRAFVEKRLASRDLLFDEIPEHMVVSPIVETRASVDHDVIEQLVDWALDQEDHIQTIVFDFLDEPEEDTLEETLLKLADEGVTLHEVSAPKPQTLTDFILGHLPLSLDELYQLARSSYQSRRPEAAVRTILRKLTRNGTIQLNGDLYEIIST